MRRNYKNIEPDHKAPAKLYKDGKFIAELSCQVWFPRHNHERPFLLFDSTDKDHEAIGSISQFCDVFMDIVKLGNRRINIYARRMIVENFLRTHHSPVLPPLITFEGIPEAIIETVSLGTDADSTEKSHNVIYLMDNFLLSPSKIIERSYTGETKVKDVRIHKDLIEGLGEVTFDKHFYTVSLDDGGTASYRKLVAVFDTEQHIKDIAFFESAIKPIIDDYLLLASFASEQMTNILGFMSSNEHSLIRGWYGNVIVRSPERKRHHSHNDVLIDMMDFPDFMHLAATAFSRFDADQKHLIRRAIYNVLPGTGTVESNMLRHFSAIESILLVHRRQNDMEFTISKTSHWNKLAKSLRKTVRENESLFTTTDHMQMLIKMLPSLRRVPLQDAFYSFIKERNIDLSDLWPVFGPAEGATLSDVRNKLIHGDSFKDERFISLSHAMSNTECVAKRLILSILGWNIDKSSISKGILKTYGWIPNSDLAKDMRLLS